MEGYRSNVVIISHGRVVFPPDQKEKKKEKKQIPASGDQEEKRFLGVRKRSSGRFAAEIRHPGTSKKLWLGTYDTAEEAAAAYEAAAVRLRGPEARTIAASGSMPPAIRASSVPNAGGSTSARVYCCSICSQEFPSPQALGGHSRKHKTSAAGDTNGYLFYDSSCLRFN